MPSKQELNWIVPFRRAVVTAEVSYRRVFDLWLESMREDTDNFRVLEAWYFDPEGKGNDFKISTYVAAIHTLRHWVATTFEEENTIKSSAVGISTVSIDDRNFHARLWKGPKRVLAEQRANGDTAKLAEIQPFTLEGGCIALQTGEGGTPRDFDLLVGDVLELPIHEFLSAGGLERFDDVKFDPTGSFYLGTTVQSKSGRKRTDLPRIHDSMLAMRFQLITALNMANCYHDEPVYSRDYIKNKVPAAQLKPQGAGIHARGMPFGGNSSSSIRDDKGTSSPHWYLYQPNTNLPKKDRPRYLPTRADVERYSDGLPLTWGWTCTPFVLFFTSIMTDSHQDQDGHVYPNEFRVESLAASLCLSTSKELNEDALARVYKFQKQNNDSLLLLHRLTPDHTQVPREQPPLADLFSIMFPKERGLPEGRPFSSPDRIAKIRQPDKNQIIEMTWGTADLCPDAGVVVVSSSEGHEFALTKLYRADKILRDAIARINQKIAQAPPQAGRISAYNPLTGEDYCANVDVDGLFFTTESAAAMPPTGAYTNLQLSSTKIHKFQPTPANVARFQWVLPPKKPDKDQEPWELQIDESDSKFRDKEVSGIFYLREGGPDVNDPRTLWDIFEIPRESWVPVRLAFTWTGAPNDAKNLLADLDKLYGERAVPFPTILEAAPGFPSRARVIEQLDNHRQRLEFLGTPNAAAKIQAEMSAASDAEKGPLKIDLKMTDVDENGKRKLEALRRSIIKLVSNSTNGNGE